MVYGPCGPQNMQVSYIKHRICQKKYSKYYQEVISIDSNGYFQYQRKNNGRTFNINNHIIKN